VPAPERAARYGHRPGIFLLPNRASLADAAERALFENGFAAITIDGNQISSGYLLSLLKSVWSAGLLVLLVMDTASPQLAHALERMAGGSLFDLRLDSDGKSRDEIATQIVSRAETLRIGGPSDQSNREAANE